MDLFELQAVLRLNASEYTKGIDDAEKKGSGFLDGLAEKWTSVKSKFQTAGSLLSPIIGVVSDAVDAYGQYEQAVGGVRKLFGDSASTITRNARKAFQTAGISINDYMELCIQSGSTMLKSVGEDSAKAAELMDLAIIDMADNVNALGTSMTSVQNAYRGFARGNFTMLDNLALGYAGTKEGMEELLKDAEKLSGVHYDIGSYADIVQAIHVIQQHRNISGTSAAEATETVVGSKAYMEAAKQNMLVVLADKEATQDEKTAAAQAYGEAIRAYIQNLMPVIQEIVKSLATAITGILPELTKPITDILVTVLSDRNIWNAVFQMVKAILKGLADGAADLFVSAMQPVAEGYGSAMDTVDSFFRNPFGATETDTFGTGARREKTKEQIEMEEALKARMDLLPEKVEDLENFRLENGIWVYTPTDANHPEMKLPTQPVTNPEDLMVLDAKYGGIHSQYGLRNVTEAERGEWSNFRRVMQTLGYDLSWEKIQGMINEGYELPDEIKNAEMDVVKADLNAATVTFANGVTINANDILPVRTNPAPAEEEGIAHAKGLWDVPYDNYLARLHRDEMVLTASQARQYREGRNGFNAADMYGIIAEAVAAAVSNIQINMDGESVGNAVADTVSRNIYQQAMSRRYG